MRNGTGNIWMVATLAVALGAGELVAYQGFAPHAQALLSSGESRAVLKAAEIVAHELTSLAVESAQQAAGAMAMHAVKQTSQLYRLALHAEQAALDHSCPLTRAAKAGAACGSPAGAVWASQTSATRAVEASAACTDKATGAAFADHMDRAAAGCPACPSCPASTAPASAGAPFGWAGLARAMVIVRI